MFKGFKIVAILCLMNLNSSSLELRAQSMSAAEKFESNAQFIRPGIYFFSNYNFGSVDDFHYDTFSKTVGASDVYWDLASVNAIQNSLSIINDEGLIDTNGLTKFSEQNWLSIYTNLISKFMNNSNNWDRDHLRERAGGSMTASSWAEASMSSDGRMMLNNYIKAVSQKSYVGLWDVSSYSNNYSDETYSRAVHLTGRLYILKATRLYDVIMRLEAIGATKSSISDEELKTILGNLNEDPKSLFEFVQTTSFNGATGVKNVPVGATPTAQAVNDKLYAKLNKSEELSSDGDKLTAIINTALLEMSDNLQRISPEFQVVTFITKSFPVRANIGNKEGLKIDNRYYIYEKSIVTGNYDSLIAKMRVKKVGENNVNYTVVDDSTLAELSESKFYRVGGGANIKMGQVIKNKEDFGIGIALGYGTMDWLRFDYRLKGYTPGLKVFLGINPYPGKVKLDETAFKSYGFIPSILSFYSSFPGFNVVVPPPTAVAYNLSLGIEKTMMFSSVISVTPFISGGLSEVSLTGDAMRATYQGETSSWTWDFENQNSDIWFSIYGNAGARFGIWLTKDIILNASAAYNLSIDGGYNDPGINIDGDIYYCLGGYEKETNQTVLENYWSQVLVEKPNVPNGLTWDVTLRYEF